jgi:hypothetical protein
MWLHQLSEDPLVKPTTLVNPAPIFGLHSIPVPRACVSLNHEGSVGFFNNVLGLVDSLAESGKYLLGIEGFDERRRATPSFLS